MLATDAHGWKQIKNLCLSVFISGYSRAAHPTWDLWFFCGIAIWCLTSRPGRLKMLPGAHSCRDEKSCRVEEAGGAPSFLRCAARVSRVGLSKNSVSRVSRIGCGPRLLRDRVGI